MQTHENLEKGKRHESTGDVVVSEDFRSVYLIAKDGSRRRIKDKEQVCYYVADAKRSLERQAEEAERRRAQRAADEANGLVDLEEERRRKSLAAVLPLLALGGMLGHQPSRMSR